jgi:hypothetical protein
LRVASTCAFASVCVCARMCALACVHASASLLDVGGCFRGCPANQRGHPRLAVRRLIVSSGCGCAQVGAHACVCVCVCWRGTGCVREGTGRGKGKGPRRPERRHRPATDRSAPRLLLGPQLALQRAPMRPRSSEWPALRPLRRKRREGRATVGTRGGARRERGAAAGGASVGLGFGEKRVARAWPNPQGVASGLFWGRLGAPPAPPPRPPRLGLSSLHCAAG